MPGSNVMYEKDGPAKGWSEEQVALMKELYRKWRTPRLKRKR